MPESTMDTRRPLPIRLTKPPLVEAVFEIRFEGEKFVGDLLPGLIYGRLGSDYKELERLPAASLPRELRTAEANLRYQPLVKLSGVDEALLIGDHVLTISKTPPYSGWQDFRRRVLSVLAVAQETRLLTGLERFSMKAVNILDFSPEGPLAHLNLKVEIANQTIVEDRGFRLRCEMDVDDFVSVLEIGATVTYGIGGQSRDGLLVSMDAIRSVKGFDLWADLERQVENSHLVLKRLFFDVLSPKTIESLGPVWSE